MHISSTLFRILFSLTSLFMTANVAAQEQPPATPPPPCQGEIYHQFDFWIGDWDVYSEDGQKLGQNLITREENGCLILEKWTSANGNTGQSFNYVDTATLSSGKPLWRQIWVSGGFTIDYTGGLNDMDEMVLVGTLAGRDGTTVPFRGTWTPQDDGTVRQFFEHYNTEQKEWTSWFIGIYHRKEH